MFMDSRVEAVDDPLWHAGKREKEENVIVQTHTQTHTHAKQNEI